MGIVLMHLLHLFACVRTFLLASPRQLDPAQRTAGIFHGVLFRDSRLLPLAHACIRVLGRAVQQEGRVRTFVQITVCRVVCALVEQLGWTVTVLRPYSTREAAGTSKEDAAGPASQRH